MPFTKEEIEWARARWPGLILTDDQATRLKKKLTNARGRNKMMVAQVNDLIGFLSFVLVKYGNVMLKCEDSLHVQISYIDGIEVGPASLQEPMVLIRGLDPAEARAERLADEEE